MTPFSHLFIVNTVLKMRPHPAVHPNSLLTVHGSTLPGISAPNIVRPYLPPEDPQCTSDD